MKVILLDIDGVLNGGLWADQHGGSKLYEDTKVFTQDNVRWDPACVQRLMHIIDATGARVVMSSTWREHFTQEDFKAMFAAYGANPDIIGMTDVLPSKKPPEYVSSNNREDDIRAWAERHAPALGVSHWVAIDDDVTVENLPKVNYVLTNFEYGLRDGDVKEAILKLGRDDEDSDPNGRMRHFRKC